MPNLVALSLMVSYKKIFNEDCKTCDPRCGAELDLRVTIWALLVEAHKIRLYIKFGKPRLYG